MNLKTLSTGSDGNCYVLTSASGKRLVLDAGVSKAEIIKGCNFDVKSIAGVIVTHEHKDHTKSVDDLIKAGLDVFQPYLYADEKFPKKHFDCFALYDGFRVYGFDLPHNGVTNRGFLIQCDNQWLLYMTDMEYCPYSFKNYKVNHMLIECNYRKDYVKADLPNYEHKVRGHCELNTTLGIIKANATYALQTVILCHMGQGIGEIDKTLDEVRKVAKNANIDYAAPGKEWELNEVPF